MISFRVFSTLFAAAEAITYGCFKLLMEFMEQYFPPKNGMAQRMANLRALLQVRGWERERERERGGEREETGCEDATYS